MDKITRAAGSPNIWQIIDGDLLLDLTNSKGLPILIHANCPNTNPKVSLEDDERLITIIGPIIERTVYKTAANSRYASWTKRKDKDSLICTRCGAVVPEKMYTCALLLEADYLKQSTSAIGPVIVTNSSMVILELTDALE
jgi:hypothetical protein